MTTARPALPRNPIRAIERGRGRMTMDQTAPIRRMRKQMAAQDKMPTYDATMRRSMQQILQMAQKR